ncbi:HEPN domain-containing protein [bacterium]|nr:HEPN domain-containing protein [bacterium]
MDDSKWDEVEKWHFAIAGLKTNTDSLELYPGVTIEKLKLVPTETELTNHLKDALVAGVMQHYCSDQVIQHELVIDATMVEDSTPTVEQAGHILAGLRICTEAEIICPAFCDRSWADLREATTNSCEAELLERAMYSHSFENSTTITEDDLYWVRDNLELLESLAENARFATARDALSTYMHAANYRMMAAQLWAGIEAIFEAQHEISYCISLWAALLLEKRGSSCKERRTEIKKLYNGRSTAVHGGNIDDDDLKIHVASARGLLANLLSKIVERGSMPSRDDFHELTTMPSAEEAQNNCPACYAVCPRSNAFCPSCGTGMDIAEIAEKVT